MADLTQFLVKKYGLAIVSELLTTDLKVLKDKRRKFGEGQLLVEAQMREFVQQGVLSEEDYEKGRPWAFDFPGWLGTFNRGAKSVMIIGLEPHIQEYDFQVAYSFAETAHVVPPSSHAIWGRIRNLIFPNLSYQDALNKLYITDLCHFAPKGNTNRIKNLKHWSAIRTEVAIRFLFEEIETVKPKIILAQGGDTFRFMKNNLGLTSTKVLIPTGYKRPATYKIQFGKINGTQIIGVPHLGTEFNLTKKFWENNLEQVRSSISQYCDLTRL